MKGGGLSSQREVDAVAREMRKKTQGFGKKPSEQFGKSAQKRVDAFARGTKAYK